MAVMTFDINVARGLMRGDGFLKCVVKFTGPSTYTTGGDAITPAQVRMGTFEWFPVFAISDGTTIRLGHYNHTTGKVMFFTEAFVEVANGVDISAFSGRVLVHGK